MPVTARFFCPTPLASGSSILLPPAAARHVQVLRLQPGDALRLFDDTPAAGEYEATVGEMGRQSVQVQVGPHHPVDREAARAVQLAISMPANERMDWLVEKATELGVAEIQPLMTQRSVVRLRDERASKRTAHWRAIAIAACEQCGRNRLPVINSPTTLALWGQQQAATSSQRLVLSLAAGSRPLRDWLADSRDEGKSATLLAGPEGGLTDAEEQAAIATGFVPVSLGPRILRSETAAIVALTLLT